MLPDMAILPASDLASASMYQRRSKDLDVRKQRSELRSTEVADSQLFDPWEGM